MSTLRIEKVTALPATLTANTLYFVSKVGSGLVDIFISDNEGAGTKHVATKSELLSNVVVYSDSAPAFPCDQHLWWNIATGVLYIQYNDGTSINWVEAIPSYKVPDFAGTGEANTMARSDHWHDSIVLGAAEW